MIFSSHLKAQTQPIPDLVHKWVCVGHIEKVPSKASLNELDLGRNMRFRSVREERVDRLHYVIWEGFGAYKMSSGKLTLKYSSMSKTWCHKELGPSVSFLKVPPSSRTIAFSSPDPQQLVLQTNSQSFLYVPHDWDGVYVVNGDADGIWWKPHIFEDLFGKSMHKKRRYVHRSSRG
jgi:hypothetical protein